MKKIFLPFAAVALLLSSCKDAAPKEELVINLQEKGAEVASSMYGIFFEEINHAGDGGLYAELVKNRSFEELEMPEGYYAEGDVLHPKKVCNHISGEVREGSFRWTTEPVPGWTLSTKDAAEMKLTKEQPKFSTAPNNLKVTIKNASTPVRLINEGYWGMNLVKDNSYQLRTIIRPASDYKGKVTALLLSEQGEVLASAPVDVTAAGQWNDLSLAMQPTATSAKGKLALEFDAPGTVYVDYVSLFPEKTFHDRPNGLRKDVAEILEGLHPAFVRWPGGCVVEGISLENRFEWKKSLGDPAARSGEYSTWGYRCSYGFGYHEMLQFCEDIDAKAMFVCNVGLGCQYRMGDASPESKIAYYLDDCMDAIEYAIGDVTTEWGAKRAEQGHPEPFPLQYVEIGNENWGDEYDKRFDIFYTAIKAKYPELILISNHGLGGTGKIAKTDMDRVATILNISLQLVANLAIAFEPFLPFSSEKLRNMLNMDSFDWATLGSTNLLPAGHQLATPELLFEKIEDSVIEAQVQKLLDTKKANEEANYKANPIRPNIEFDDFMKLDIRVGTVLECQKVPKADKLLQFKIADGLENRTIVSGIAQHYNPEELVGKQVCFIANLAPRKLKGIVSEGMILSAENFDGSLSVVTTMKEVKPGSEVK